MNKTIVKNDELRFVQIECVPVPNTVHTQCHVFMYGLTNDGKLWFKRDVDEKWSKESLKRLP